MFNFYFNHFKKKIYKLLRFTIFIVPFCVLNNVQAAEDYAPWLTQIGMNEQIVSAAKWGKGVKLGVVDTGIVASSPFFSKGQISNKQSSCAAVSFACSNKFNDDHGHGTAVAAIAAGNLAMPWESYYGGYLTRANSAVSVAPSANIVAQKVLDASGSAYSSDVANGIRKAASTGASVINVSISFANTQDIVSSINFAASKGAYIVWAGGNSGSEFSQNADTSGLSPEALSRLVFAGSVDANSTKSSFSNTPGTGNLNAADAQLAYAQRWLMTPGENILAPYSISQPNAWGYWSGTSMSAPILSGSLVLLQSAWPILKSNGQAINLLMATATDLGDAGTDSVYGAGLVNLAKAFQPVGNLTVKNAKKSTVNVSDLNGTVIAAGALGKLTKIKKKLANYTAFDGYQRNFSVNLAHLIQSPNATASVNALPTHSKTNAKSIKLVDGTIMSTWTQTSFFDVNHADSFNYDAQYIPIDQSIFLSFDYKDGSNFSVGNGYATQYAYAKAFYGNEDFANLNAQLSTNAFAQLAEGGKMLNYGVRLNEKTRMAFAWHSKNHEKIESDFTNSALNNVLTRQSTQTNLFKMGINYRNNPQMQSGLTLSYLDEENGLLGSRVENHNALGLSEQNKSLGLDFSLGIHFDENNMLMLEKGFAITKSAPKSALGNGFITQATALYAQSFGGTYLSKNVWQKNDTLSFSIKQPLSVTHGKAAFMSAEVDEMGYAQYKNTWVGLAPSGRQTDYLVSYEKNVNSNQSLAFQAYFNDDIGNINHEKNAGLNIVLKFYD